ncbi:MAG: ABC transporter ATP-binding protein [Oscillospiraceae bacterium]|nr:ABC transporter ATP-binding protein [Oscillospiraceae bacterium]
MIRFENVRKSYRGNDEDVVRGISFTVPKGKLVVLVGPSGCGKTTCLKMINRLVKNTGGSICIAGKEISEYDPIQLRRSIGYVIQQTGLFPHLTVRENIEIIPRLEGRDEESIALRTAELMKMVGLDADAYLNRYPIQLSGGQLQRVGVARAFATDPEIILMDEPFSALDPITRAQLQGELLFLQAKLKKTIVFVTHDMDEAVKMGDLICIMKEGRIVQYDTPEQIMKHPADDYIRSFVGQNRIWGNPEYIYAEDIMLRTPLAVPRNLSVLQAMRQMNEQHVTSALVLDDDHRLLGAATALEMQKAAAGNESVQAYAHPVKICAKPRDSLVQLLQLMQDNKLSMLPVLDETGRLQGLITNSSLVTVMSQQFTEEKEVTAQ